MIGKERASIADAWITLLATPPTRASRWRAYELPVGTPWGPVALAVDADGTRHLLIPILSRTRVRSGLDGPGLALGTRVLEDDDSHTTYADLACRRPELSDLFSDLCADIVNELTRTEQPPLRAVYRVVDRWRSLFDRSGGILSDEVAAGMAGELVVLTRLLERDPSAHRSWRGPSGDRHDFVGETVDLEVKSTTRSDTRSVVIHGLDQLDPPTGGRLVLVWFRLADTTTTGTGSSLLEMADRALALADDEPALLGRFAEVGYVPRTIPANDARRYTLVEECWYEVDEEFPRLTRAALDRAGMPATVTAVTYTVDLAGRPPEPLAPAAVSALLVHGIGAAV